MSHHNPSNLSLRALRQCAAAIVACAIQDLYPDVQLVGGESTDIGFFYDFIFKKLPDEALMPQVEERIRAIITADHPIRSLTMMPKNAAELFKHHGQSFKAHEALQAKSQFLEILQMGDFYDLCPTPHIASSKEVVALKLLEIIPQQPYFSKMGDFTVTRIVGTAFFDKNALKQFVKQIKAAKEQDHRILGSELNIFRSFDAVAFGSPFWLPEGMKLQEYLVNWWKKEQKEQGLQLLSTPKMVNRAFIQQAGWLDREGIVPIPLDLEEGDEVLVANPAPLHEFLFQQGEFSPAKWPVRYAEWGEWFADIPSAKLYGMLRTRSISTDHAHIFCSEEQVLKELISSLHFIDRMSKMFNLTPKWILRSRLPQRKKRLESGKKALEWLGLALETCQFEYEQDPTDGKGDYPKLEMCLLDALGQEWAVSNVWVDPRLSEGSGAEKQAYAMIGRSVFGSLERFVALLLEINGKMMPKEWFS